MSATSDFPASLAIDYPEGRKYPRWWFDRNLTLTKFAIRVWAYLALLRDEYPSTDDERRCMSDSHIPIRPARSTGGCRSSNGCSASRTTLFWDCSVSPRSAA